MPNTNVPNRVMKNTDPVPPEVRKGDDKWPGFVRQWEYEGRPGFIIVGSFTYQVLQDPETTERYFRPQNSLEAYQSRSF
jgi:hypothetical protein